ncbi:MAG: hypothetical protein KKF50_04740 [Nanoarchaeota archaeon]|nr:hypothetical protein [Nanoarchaeota archaeon]
MRNFLEKLDKKVNKKPRKSLDFYNNLISGIIGGTIIGFTIEYLRTSGENIISYGLITFILWLILGFLIIWRVSSGDRRINQKLQYKNYLLNLYAAIVGAFYVSALILFPKTIFRILSTIVLILLTIFILFIIQSTK